MLRTYFGLKSKIWTDGQNSLVPYNASEQSMNYYKTKADVVVIWLF